MRPINWLIYPGPLLWLTLLSAGIFMLKNRHLPQQNKQVYHFFFAGVFYCVCALLLLGKNALDFRYFMPALPFLLIPVAHLSTNAMRFKIVLVLFLILAGAQTTSVLKKTHNLRHISSDMEEVISFLEANPILGTCIFMYPEGNYRLFPYRPI